MYRSGYAHAVPAESSNAGPRSQSSSENRLVQLRRATISAKKEKAAEQAEKLRLLGNEYFKQRDFSAAAQHYFVAIMIHGPKAILLSNLAAAYLKLDAFDEAEWVATVALEYEPKHLKARFRRGIARREGLALDAAVRDFETVLLHDPTCAEARSELEITRTMLFMGDGRDFSGSEGEDYPNFHGSPWESQDDSDSPDAKHIGIRKSPCRYHNRNGCRKGQLCDFSHAPDNNSVRDERGRNVCMHFLLDDCKYGEAKCAYSHDRSYLPSRGWWNYPDQVAAAKKLHPILADLDHDDIDIVLRQHPKMKNFAKRQKERAVLDLLEFKHSMVMCDVEEREELGTVYTSVPITVPTSQPFVMVLSLEDAPTFNSIHNHFLRSLKSKIPVVQAVSVDHVIKCLESPYLTAIFATDPYIARPKNQSTLSRILDFVKVRGGTLVVGGLFSTHIPSNEFDSFMTTVGLPWRYGSYHRTTFSLNNNNSVVRKNSSLTSSYSMKTLHAADILPQHAVYRTTAESRTQSFVFPSVNVNDQNEAPVVQATLGKGSFGFIGDVNAETDSTKTVLAMLGLLDELEGTLTRVRRNAGSSQEGSVDGPKSALDGKAEKKNASKNSAKSSSKMAASKQPISQQDGAAGPSRFTTTTLERKSVIVATLANPDLFESVHSEQLAALSEHADIIRTLTSSDLISHLSNAKNLVGIYVADEGIVQQSNKQALSKVVEYVTKKAGNVVVGGLFPSMARPADYPILFGALGLPWKAGSYIRLEAAKNDSHPVAIKYGQKLPDEISMKAVSVSRLEPHNLVYRKMPDTTNKDDEWECPVLQATVGADHKGQVGYIGDVNAEEATTNILLAMLEVLPSDPPPQEDRQPFLLVLHWMVGIGNSEQEDNKDFYAGMKSSNIEVIQGVSNARAVEHLKSQDLVGVMVSDASITDPSQA